MELSNTLENKAKYLAQHIDCELEYPNTDGKIIVHELTGVSKSDGLETTYKRKNQGCSGDYLSFKDNGWHKSNAINAKIRLKSLSSITDEDAIEVAKILYPKDTYVYSQIQSGKSFARNITLNEFEYRLNVKRIVTAIDYLRSKGYALPFMGLSVEQLIEYGWLKLNT